MLALKATLASHPKFLRPSLAPTASISDLPQEVLDVIVRFLYQATGHRIVGILAFSRACRQFRISALPVLFESVSFSVRQELTHLPHPSFAKLATQPRLLSHVKILSLYQPLLGRSDGSDDEYVDVDSALATLNEQEALVDQDVGLLKNSLDHMFQLREIRYEKRLLLLCSFHIIGLPCVPG
jgi:hypothetical protein